MRKGFIIGALVVVVVVVFFVLLASVDSIVKAAIELNGSDVTETQVTLDDVSISTTSGEGTIRGLVIGHPQGFDERVMRIGEAQIALDIRSLISDTIVIKEITVTAPQVTVEVNQSGANVSHLQNTPSQGGDGSSDSGGSAGGDPEDKKKIVIERLTIAERRVDLKAAQLGSGVGADLPSITLRDIGKDKDGASAEEVAKTILAAVSTAVSQAAITSGALQKIEGEVGDKAKSLLEKGSGGVRNLLNRR